MLFVKWLFIVEKDPNTVGVLIFILTSGGCPQKRPQKSDGYQQTHSNKNKQYTHWVLKSVQITITTIQKNMIVIIEITDKSHFSIKIDLSNGVSSMLISTFAHSS